MRVTYQMHSTNFASLFNFLLVYGASKFVFPPIVFSTFALLVKKKLRNELRIQDRQDQLRHSQGFRSSCLTDVHVAIRVAKVTLLIKLLNINEKQA